MTDERIRRITMPKWGLSMTSGTITDWLVSEGEEVTEGTELAEIDTDKIAGTLESSEQGVLRGIVVPAGRSAPVGGTIAIVAPAEVPDAEVQAAVAEAEEQLASGEVVEATGPATGTVEVGGRTLSYATVGDGPEVVVLVHGFGGDKDSWLFVQEPLAAGRTVHALDLPGHGASTKDVGDGGLEVLADAVTGFLDALGVERAHLVGHSLGGAVVSAAAARQPDRVRSLTLVAPAGCGAEINAEYLRGFVAASTRRELKPHLRALFADESQVTRQLVDDLLKFKRIDGVQDCLRTLLGTLLDGDKQAIDTASLLAGVSVPTAVVWGDQDQVVPVAAPEVFGDGVRVRVVEGAGHMVHMEAPTATREAIESVLG
ncbi:acetoin dehydrogenase dihydrolipoyllysine-residue acetyltransferase subunit [Saccharopolyspora hordei]|uniref:Pyruvate dehydrogenase E2 component (Dihydrolipoamide acetyltransferase) n=1 Tax=Saccharopolyspora hordei TaxID=1838 RepID=A0A853AKG8_9PSEU|nr:acetoin dehydrogenase dihydrolipoyllysine-residue acetyltransferase subunit [Saccharopolyspora hordei]NYI84528.1 pyruvate dehydrogenase E2 component (dihydrolipoamide acetyltransferase) [Saccharopolyspora hordei]